MKKKTLIPKRAIIKSFTKADADFLALYGIYKDTIDPTLTYDEFVSMYRSQELVAIDFTLFVHNGERVGFSAAFFYATRLNGKKAFILRSATGLLETYQGKGYHDVFDLYAKFIRFAVKHPFTPVYAVAFVINPFVFSELCRFVPRFFPRPNIHVPEEMQQVMDEIIVKSSHERDSLHPFAVQVPIQVKFTEAMLKRIFGSKNEDVLWFLENLPGILDKYGLLVVVAVSWSNVYGTLLNLGQYYYPRTKFARDSKILWQKSIELMRNVFQRWTL